MNVSNSKNDEIFKKGCLEFLRKLSIIRPDLCSSVGGFKILINSLLDASNYDIQDYILYSLLYIINSPTKRKYFNGFDDFYKIFSVFTKSDFTNKNNPKDKKDNKNNDPNALENEKKRIELSKNVIENRIIQKCDKKTFKNMDRIFFNNGRLYGLRLSY